VIQAYGEPVGATDGMCTTTNGCGAPRLPTASEIHQQFVHWRATAMTGYLVFAWRWPADTPSLWLENQPDLQTQLKAENG
jgi:hypothetical protein